MLSNGGSHALKACEQNTGIMGLWKQLMGLLEMAGRGASMAPFIGEREMRGE